MFFSYCSAWFKKVVVGKGGGWEWGVANVNQTPTRLYT